MDTVSRVDINSVGQVNQGSYNNVENQENLKRSESLELMEKSVYLF